MPSKCLLLEIFFNFANLSLMEFPEKITIRSNTTIISPRYCETDQGGIVHHSVYPIYFEIGRTELLRENGLAYKKLEEAGFFMVIAELNLKYRFPAYYDEKLTLTTTCSKVTSAKIEHAYELKNEIGRLLTEGKSILACIDANGRPRRVPSFLEI